MTDIFSNKVILASGNVGKLKELQKVLSNLELALIPQAELNIDDAEETGLTFIENALIKARHAAAQSGLPAIADDSGLVVTALNGAPGIYSSRYAGEQGNAAANIDKVLTELKDVPTGKREAYFYCVIAYLQHAADPTPIVCQGRWQGAILLEKRGTQGFGYDPIFYVPTHKCSAAELTLSEKNSISHRGQALQQLKRYNLLHV